MIKKLQWLIKKKLYILKLGEIQLKMHEQDASPILQLTSLKKFLQLDGYLIKMKKSVFKKTICDTECIVKVGKIYSLLKKKKMLLNHLY